MKANLGRILPPHPAIAVAFAAAAGLAMAAVLAGESRLPPVAEWLLAFSLLFILAAAYAKVLASRICMAGRLAGVLDRIADGEEPWGPHGAADADLGRLGEELASAIQRLAESCKVTREQMRRSEMALATMADGIIAVDSDGRITLFNEAAAKALGHERSRIVGTRPEDADLHPEIARLAHECASRKAILSSEIRLAGTPPRAISIRATPFRTAASGPDSALIILHDLTEVRRHEKNQKEFVSNVSHELRTPLTAVRTTAEALLSGAKNDEELLDRFLRTIIAESDRLSALIEDLTDIARRDSGMIRTLRMDVNIAEAVNRAVSVVGPLAREEKVEIGVDVGAELVGWCDEAQLSQILRNLVDNAVKYTPSGGSIEVSAREVEGNLVIRVKDTGIGIPHGEVDRIFERFYRVDKARSRRLGGTGLGLAIVRDIVQSYGGQITVETQLGKGSTFTVTLPGPTGAADAAGEGPDWTDAPTP